MDGTTRLKESRIRLFDQSAYGQNTKPFGRFFGWGKMLHKLILVTTASIRNSEPSPKTWITTETIAAANQILAPPINELPSNTSSNANSSITAAWQDLQGTLSAPSRTLLAE